MENSRCCEFTSELFLPRTRAELFPFFANAQNLEVITPGWLSFKVVGQTPSEMRQGTIIDYKLRIRGIPVRWQSEITVWEPPFRFVDEQRKGPYRQWVHEHRFEEAPGGTLVKDHVRYAVLGGWLVDRLLVRRDVRAIFRFREQRMTELFGGK